MIGTSRNLILYIDARIRMICVNLINMLFCHAACHAPRMFANPALRSVSGTEYCGIVNGRYFPCLFSITRREIVVAVFVIAVDGICTAMIRIGTCIRCNGKFCAPPFVANILPRYPPRFFLAERTRFPAGNAEIDKGRFRSSDLSSFRETVGGDGGAERLNCRYSSCRSI